MKTERIEHVIAAKNAALESFAAKIAAENLYAF